MAAVERRPPSVQRLVLWALDLGSAPPTVSPRVAAELSEIGADPGLVAAMGHEGRLVAGRVKRGCRCFAARVGGEIAAYAWVSVGDEWIGEIQSSIRLSAGDAYVWNCVTLSHHRRCRLYTALLGVVAATLAAEGMRRLWVATLVSLPHAGRGVAAAGFSPVLRAVTFRAGGVMLLWLAGDRRVRPELTASARRSLGGRLQVRCQPGVTAH